MEDRYKTRKQLLDHIADLRAKVGELEQAHPCPRLPKTSDSGHHIVANVDGELSTDLLESISDGLIALDSDLVTVYFNRAAERVLGKKREEVEGRPLFEAFPEAKGSVFEENYKKAVRERAYLVFQTYFDTAPYENWYSVRVYPNPDGITVLFQVITEQKKAEQALQESEARYRATFEQATAGIAHVGLDGLWLRSNEQLSRILGYSSEELKALLFTDVTHPDDLPMNLEAKESLIHGDTHVYRTEKRYIHKNGAVIWCRVSVSLLRDDNGDPLHFISIIEDITDRRAAEEALRESEERYQAIFEAAGDALFLHDLEGKFLDVNRVAVERLGYSRDEFLNMTPADIDRPDCASKIEERLRIIKQTGGVSFETVHVTKDGREIPVEIIARLISFGNRTTVLSIARDISERKRTELLTGEQRELSTRLSATSDLNQALSMCVDTLMRMADMDTAAAFSANDDGGFDPEIVRGKREALSTPPVLPPPDSHDGRLIRQGKAVYRDGEDTSSERRGRQEPHPKNGGTAMIPVLHEDTVTACFVLESSTPRTLSPQARQALETIAAQVGSAIARIRSEQQLSLIQFAIDRIGIPAFCIRSDGRIVYVNHAACKSLGYSKEDFMHMSSADVDPNYPAEIWPDHFRALKSMGTMVFESNHRTREGLLFPVEITANYVEFRGQEYNWAFASNISERKQAEALQLQTVKYKAVADLASGVAHNFNNLLQIVIGNANLALLDLQAGDFTNIREALEQIIESSLFGAETVRRLNSFSKLGSSSDRAESEVFNLSEMAKQAVEMTRPWWKTNPEKEGIPITLNLSLNAVCPVRGRKNEIFEVIVNLLKNSAEALRGGGTIDITVAEKDEWATLRVSDSGRGIPGEHITRLFTPFFTTNVEAGRGLGLASSRRIVDDHGGVMFVESTEGEGTELTVSLPLAKRPSETADSADENTVEPPMSILVIDDVKPVTELLRTGLQRRGHLMSTATSGEEGLRILEETKIDLIICDLAMPGMNGWQVGRRVAELCEERGMPKPPFILLTGWGDQAKEAEKIADSGVDAVVEKPVDIPGLVQVIKESIS